MTVKITGIQPNTAFWTGSVGSGFIFICSHIVMPMMMGQMPMAGRSRAA